MVLVLIWSGAAGGIVLSLLWPDAPRPVSAAIYISLGLGGDHRHAAALRPPGRARHRADRRRRAALQLGAIVYARKRPDPVPTVFGYHEIFHVLVVAAAALHFAVIAFLVVPLAD